MFPSTRATASIAGFVAGGSGGVGSITWGGLRDFGNVLRLRVLTMEAEPRALELTGEDLHKAVHAYGTNGVITEVEMPLDRALRLGRRHRRLRHFRGRGRLWAGARRAGRNTEEARHRRRGARAAGLFPAPSRRSFRRARASSSLMIAPHALDAFDAFTRPFNERESCSIRATLRRKR